MHIIDRAFNHTGQQQIRITDGFMRPTSADDKTFLYMFDVVVGVSFGPCFRPTKHNFISEE